MSADVHSEALDKYLINLFNFDEVERQGDVVYVNRSDKKLWCNRYQMEQLLESYKDIFPTDYLIAEFLPDRIQSLNESQKTDH